MTNDESAFISDILKRVESVPADSILSHKLFDGPQLGLTLFLFAPGQELSEHTASRPAVLHFIRGQGELRLGTDQHLVGSGSWAYMPAHLPHAVRAESELVMLLYLLGG